MNKFLQIISSRTFWTIVVTVVVNGIALFGNLIPHNVTMGADIFLGILATYFHITPSQTYGK